MLENQAGPHSAGLCKLFGDLGFYVCRKPGGFQSEKGHDPVIFKEISLMLMENGLSEANGRDWENSL